MCQKNVRLALPTPDFYVFQWKAWKEKSSYTFERLRKQVDPMPEPIQLELAMSSILMLIYHPSLFTIQGITQP